jgi:hypothetical protein
MKIQAKKLVDIDRHNWKSEIFQDKCWFEWIKYNKNLVGFGANN